MSFDVDQIDNIQIGTVLVDAEQKTKHVVIAIVAGKCTLCKCNSTRLDVSIIELDVILDLQFEGKIVLEKVEPVQIHIEKLPDKVRASFDNRKKFIEEVLNEFGPDYAFFVSRGNSDAFYNKIAVKYNINRVRCYYWLRVFFQSGLQFEALVDKRYLGNSKGKEFDYKTKTGRPSEFTGNKGIPLMVSLGRSLMKVLLFIRKLVANLLVMFLLLFCQSISGELMLLTGKLKLLFFLKLNCRL